MYWADHNPPHFHAEYSGMKALIDLENGVVLKGMLLNKQLKLVLAWCEIHRSELLKKLEIGRRTKRNPAD